MDIQSVKELVYEVISNYLEIHEISSEINDNTALIGSHAIVDSMGLVSIIVDIESELLDHDVEVSLTSEKAMSRKVSPFRSVGALANFIVEQITQTDE
jgi:acyl carrier protein